MKGRWRYRLVQLSPLICILLMIAIWFLIPEDIRNVGSSGVAMLTDQPEITWESIQVDVMDALLKRGVASGDSVAYYSSGPAQLKEFGNGIAGSLATLDPPAFDEWGNLRDLTPDEREGVFRELNGFEDRYSARVAVLAMPSEQSPPVALAALSNPSVLTTEERAEIEGAGTAKSIRRLFSDESAGRIVMESSGRLGEGSSKAFDGRYIDCTQFALGGVFWEAYTIVREESYGISVPSMGWDDIHDPRLLRAVEIIARESDGCVIVVGPTAEPVVVQPLRGLDEGETTTLWASLFPSIEIPGDYMPLVLTPQQMVAARGGSMAEAVLFSPRSVPRLFVLGIYDRHPDIVGLWEHLGRSPITVATVWVATYQVPILGALLVVFTASVIASPLAFHAERLSAERAEAERARRQVRLEVEGRVVERLAGLSARVDDLKRGASNSTAAGVAGVSEDIESTVSELRQILSAVQEKRGHDE